MLDERPLGSASGAGRASRSARPCWATSRRSVPCVLAIVDGLDETSLRRPVVPSGWTCLGLLEHLGHAERFWSQAVLTGAGVGAPAVADG